MSRKNKEDCEVGFQLVGSRVKTIHKSGQISIGKEMGGRYARVDKFSDGRVLITPVKVVSDHDHGLLTEDMAEQLSRFDELDSKHVPVRSSVSKLKRTIGKRRVASSRAKTKS